MIKRFYHPNDLGLEELILANQPDHIKYKERYLYVIDQLVNWRIYNKSNQDGWVPLSSSILEKLLTYKISYKLIKNLIEWGIIIPQLNTYGKKSYTIGEKCIRYRMDNKFINSKIETTKLTDKTLIKNLTKFYDKQMNSSPIVSKLNDCLFELRIHAKKVLKIMNKLVEIEGNQEEDVISSYMISTTKIMNSDFFTYRDSTGNRIHTNITNLKKEFRSALYLENKQKLVEIDIRNSQPLIFNYFLLKEYKKDLPTDVLEYIQLTSTGKLYDKIAEEKGLNPDERNWLKKKLFEEVFYCTTYLNKIYPNSIWFEKRFPNVFKLILKLKKNNYKDLPILMQKLESKVVIDGVAVKFFKEQPEGFIVSIHDSFITTESNASLIQDLILEEFSLYDLSPTVRIDYLN